jgi:uncharacterized protein
MIDIHTHILYHWSKKPLTENKLIKKMDSLGMEKFVILPIIGPEVPYYHFGTEDVLRVYRRHSGRVIPFCNIDPRAGSNSPKTNFSPLLDKYKKAGCRGLGELTANLYFDDPKCLNLYRQCGEAGFPVLFHLYGRFGGSYGLVDEVKLPRLERALKLCPKTAFIGHAPAFWSEISADANDSKRNGYPNGPVKKPGRLQKLFDKYPNLYGDISAGSGYNALTRDMDYGYEFIRKYSSRLLFGTDLCHPVQETPIVSYMRESLNSRMISKSAYDKITGKNAEKLLKLKR